MIHQPTALALFVFLGFVGFTLGLSFYFGRKARSVQGYFAAGGGIHWFVNGVAFAGDYLSAASFLGICGMIASYGYDGFLYSIGFLAGWVVALFVIAEPIKRMGKYTFADALDSRFHSKGIKLAAAVSTLVVSIFYLIPQMVGAGTLIQPLLGFPYWAGVCLVGAVVVCIVVTAGMVSTTYVQFIKGALLVIFSGVLVVLILQRGFHVDRSDLANRTQTITITTDAETGQKTTLINGLPKGLKEGEANLRPVGHVDRLPNDAESTGPLTPWEYLRTFQESEIVQFKNTADPSNKNELVFERKVKSGRELLTPGEMPMFAGIRGESTASKLNFVSLMLALFCGTASLPHILIRYYTVKDQTAARKSTVVGIGTIGAFYVLTLFLGLGAMTSGAIDLTNENMAAPLLAKSFGELPFAVISAIAFTTVLGTVSGLIVAASGAVVHDLMRVFIRHEYSDHEKVVIGKWSAAGVGAIAIGLGILFEGFNASFLVGWAFSVAASANLPALVMTLFWKRTTKQGITAAILVGMTSSLAWILASEDTLLKVFGLKNAKELALTPFSQPGIVTIPLGFAVLIIVSLLTQPRTAQR